MNRESVLKQTKLEMKRWIDQLEIHNINEVKENLESYFQMVEAVGNLPEAPPVKHKSKKIEQLELELDKEPTQEIETDKTRDIESKSEEKTVLHKTSEYEDSQGYVFERKLRGGILPDINAFVPEGIVRKLDIEHGDRLEARKMEDYADDGKNRYHYTLLTKGDRMDAPDRVQLDYCVIKKEAGSLMIDGSSLSGEKVRFNGASFSILLNEMDIRHFELHEGDIVDVAYKKSMPSEHKVLWKHEDIELPEEKSTETSKKKKVSDHSEDLVELPEQTLKGMSIMVVGNEGSRTSYQEQIEKRGGEFLWIDAKEKVEKFEPIVKKSSFVIFLLGLSGHTGMKKIKQLCKDYRIPFEATFNQGVTSIVRTAEDLADELNGTKKESISALS